jgi:hypothetical protein
VRAHGVVEHGVLQRAGAVGARGRRRGGGETRRRGGGCMRGGARHTRTRRIDRADGRAATSRRIHVCPRAEGGGAGPVHWRPTVADRVSADSGRAKLGFLAGLRWVVGPHHPFARFVRKQHTSPDAHGTPEHTGNARAPASSTTPGGRREVDGVAHDVATNVSSTTRSEDLCRLTGIEPSASALVGETLEALFSDNGFSARTPLRSHADRRDSRANHTRHDTPPPPAGPPSAAAARDAPV